MLIDKINEKTKKDNILFRIESAVYDLKPRALNLSLEYGNNSLLSPEIKKEVEQIVKEEIGFDVKVQIKYRKNFYDTEIISKFLIDELRREYPIINVNKSNIKYLNKENQDNVLVVFDATYKDFILTNNIADFIKQAAESNYHSKFEVSVEFKDGLLKIEEEKEATTFNFNEQTTEEVIVESIEPYIGELIDAPIYPVATYTEPQEGIVIAGRVQSFKENKTKEKVDEKGKTRPEKEYYTFEVSDYSGVVRVVYFPGKANLQKFKKITDGSEIVIFGNLEEDKFSSGMSLRPRVINLCVLPSGFFEKVYSKPVPKSYNNIFPQVYEQTEQSNLFVSEEEINSSYLKDNTFVVFDLETTGTNYQQDKIIEIGAVKIVNGKLSETFECLVNPECHIPEDATKVHGIKDEDVKDALTIDKIMPDFFKFCNGAIMVSYVIGFDFNFIDYNAKKLGYTFTNTTDDAFQLAKTKLKGLRNYKLITVAKHLNVSLDNAHRAVYDAVAAAEVMIRLIEKF